MTSSHSGILDVEVLQSHPVPRVKYMVKQRKDSKESGEAQLCEFPAMWIFESYFFSFGYHVSLENQNPLLFPTANSN